MSLKMERVYIDTGSELTAAGFTTTAANPNLFVYDGRYMWVACDGGIAIYEFWGESSDNEPAWETLDELIYPRYDSGPKKKLKLTTFIKIDASTIKKATRHASLSLRPEINALTPDGATTVSGVTVTLTTVETYLRVITESGPNTSGIALTPKNMALIGNKMYVASDDFTHIFEFNVDTHSLVQVIALPIRVDNIRQIGNSSLTSAGGKLWFVNTFYTDVIKQRLYSYTPGVGFAYTDIIGRPSETKQQIADGMNGFVYLALFNDVGLAKHDVTDGSYVAYVRLNAFPTGIWSDQNRRIFVNSFAGMLSLVDWDDDQVHNDYSTDTMALGFGVDYSDSTKVWWVDGDILVNYTLSTLQQIQTTAEDASPDEIEDWQFQGRFPTGNSRCLNTMPPTTYGALSVGQYIFVGHQGGVGCFKIEPRMMYRQSFTELNGQGAVVAGTSEYFGET